MMIEIIMSGKKGNVYVRIDDEPAEDVCDAAIAQAKNFYKRLPEAPCVPQASSA